MKTKTLLGAAGAALLAAGLAAPAQAENQTINMAQQFGLLYAPQHVVVENKLIQKHAQALGLPEPEVKLFKLSGGANINRALLAGSVDFAALGIGPILKLWGRSEGRFKAAINKAYMPLKLVTNDPEVKTVEDYLKVSGHQIAVPAAKVSIQAVTLQMYADQKWGEFEKLDHLVVSMSHPTAMAALLAGGQSVKSHFATLPFSMQELQSDKIHQVLSSYDFLGGEHSVTVIGASEDYKSKNPKSYQAVVNAFEEAYEWIAANPDAAAEIYIKYEETKTPKEEILAMIGDPNEIRYAAVPKGTERYANFLHKIGDIPEAKSWKDYFFDNNHKYDGS